MMHMSKRTTCLFVCLVSFLVLRSKAQGTYPENKGYASPQNAGKSSQAIPAFGPEYPGRLPRRAKGSSANFRAAPLRTDTTRTQSTKTKQVSMPKPSAVDTTVDAEKAFQNGRKQSASRPSQQSASVQTARLEQLGPRTEVPLTAADPDILPAKIRGQNTSLTSVEREELKVTAATLKLVVWLRNRLRKRLGDVADLENQLTVSKHMLDVLGQKRRNTSHERTGDIRRKQNAQKQLAELRINLSKPDEQLRIVQVHNEKLQRQLTELKSVYERLASERAQMQARLRSAGFAHWLDTRGKLYMPDTAVGVLAKSTEILEPVVDGIQKAVELDMEIANEVDGYMPRPHPSFVAGVFVDTLTVAPLIPLLALACRVSYSLHQLSIVHYVVFMSASFAMQALISLTISVFLGDEMLHFFQRSNEPVCIGILFLTSGVYMAFMVIVGLLAFVETSHRAIVHFVLCGISGVYFYNTAFRPAVLDEELALPVLVYPFVFALFAYVLSERCEQVDIQLPGLHEVSRVRERLGCWISETQDAMKRMYVSKDESCQEAAAVEDAAVKPGKPVPTTSDTPQGDDRRHHNPGAPVHTRPSEVAAYYATGRYRPPPVRNAAYASGRRGRPNRHSQVRQRTEVTGNASCLPE